MQFFTIGVYNSGETEFFEKLTSNKIDTFCDIRQRRGVRGAKYSFVNSKRLQAKLDDLGISYKYINDLAPTKEIREIQKSVDLGQGELKSERKKLGKVFIHEYQNRIIEDFDFLLFLKKLRDMDAKNIVLFCVEENHMACHRSIVAARLANKYLFNVIHL